MNVENWNWAVWVFLIMEGLTLWGAFLLHGKPRADYRFGVFVFNSATLVTLLYFGGFFA